MSDRIIVVENLSKQYRLGQIGTGSIAHDINRRYHRLRGKEDPYLKIGIDNDGENKPESSYMWALRDINFEVRQGEVLGIIGRNGAGKSTLLKILSRTTTPSTGTVKMRGRIASLLEVGTGFHPDLTGRDNIYLNGAILGMTKREITRKFDEIVQFAGVEKYIDTPVKRYSSGMYVRLAFGVAAHLEPEILIVDEVLAVGDMEFQKKALGKMKDVSAKEGRTVLFVSHNLNALKKICENGMLIKNGRLVEYGEINAVLKTYSVNDVSARQMHFDSVDRRLTVQQLSINGSVENVIDLDETLQLEIFIAGSVSEKMPLNIEARLFSSDYFPLAFFSPGHVEAKTSLLEEGNFEKKYIINLPPNMNRGNYFLRIGLSDPGKQFYGAIAGDIRLSFSGTMTASGLVFDFEKTGWLLLK